MRKYYRQIAKARMKAAGVGNVNRKMSGVTDGVKNWRRIVFGDLAKDAEGWQTRKKGRQPKRRIKKLAAA